MTSPELMQLLNVLEERDIPLTHDDIAWAFESPQTQQQITQWVHQYLSPATLLTKEELHFHDNYPQPPKPQQTSQNAGSPYISDAAFEQAIKTLETSTAAIETQSRLLQSQIRAIETLLGRNESSTSNSAPAISASAQAHAREKASLEFETAERAEVLRNQIHSSTKDTETLLAQLPGEIERIWEKDDRFLDGLEKLLPRLTDPTHDTLDSRTREIDHLCRLLAAQKGAEIRAEIEADYLTAITAPNMSNKPLTATETNGVHSSSEAEAETQCTVLRSELSELTREIDSLASMATDAEYRQPLTQALRLAQKTSETQKAEWRAYIVGVLEHLTTRLQELQDKREHATLHVKAMKTLENTLESVIAPTSTSASSASRKAVQHAPSSPAAQKGLKPLRLVQAQASLSLNQDPVTQLLKSLDLSTLPNSPADIASGTFASALAKALIERRTGVSDSAAAGERHLTRLLGESLREAEEQALAVAGSVFAGSEYGEVKLLPLRVEEGLEELERRTAEVGEMVRGFDFGALGVDVMRRQKAIVEAGR